MHGRFLAAWTILALITASVPPVHGSDLIPSAQHIKSDRPRLLVRPTDTPLAISLTQLRTGPRDADFNAMLAQLRGNRSAASLAMVYLLTGETAAADAAIARMQAYEYPGDVDTFHVYFRLQEFALAYDWLCGYEGFTDRIQAEVRAKVLPLARHGIRVADDHMFHNYIWMSAGGAMLWALATVGEDDPSDRLFDEIAERFNTGLFPAMRYLDGLPSEPMGYWALYDLTPCALALLATQSAFETDLVAAVRDEQDDWFRRHFDNLVHSTLPDLRYIPWGDMQSGPNGGVTYEMAGAIDAMTWALQSPEGADFSRRIAERRGLRRFYGDTAVFYMLYTRRQQVSPKVPPTSFLAGNRQSGHFIARSGWDDGATIVAFRATDHFGDHNHYDQGSFIIYRNGLLAVDPPVYRKIRGPQQLTESHNTLLLGGTPQRPARGQSFQTVEEFQKNLNAGKRLETGDILFSHDAGGWAAVAGQFAQAYEPDLVQSCVRQLLFVRPDKVVVVDQLAAPAGKNLPEVQWLLQVPEAPTAHGTAIEASNGKSWLRCRPILPVGPTPTVTETNVNTHRVGYGYRGQETLALVHLLEVGDGTPTGQMADVDVRRTDTALEATVDGTTYQFESQPPFAVREKTGPQ